MESTWCNSVYYFSIQAIRFKVSYFYFVRHALSQQWRKSWNCLLFSIFFISLFSSLLFIIMNLFPRESKFTSAFFQIGQKKGERRVSWKFQETSRPFSKARNYYPNVRLLLLGFLYNYRKATGKKLAPNIRPLASSSGQGRTFNFGIIFFARKKCISSVSSDEGWGWRNMFQKVDSRKVEWNGGRAVGVTASMTVRIYSIWK